MRRSWLVAPVLGLVAAGLAGCADRPVDRLNRAIKEQQAAVPSCEDSACADQVAALADALAGLPGVLEVRDTTYRPEQATDGAWVSGTMVVEEGVRCDTLEDAAAELAWQSSVSPLLVVDFPCGTPGNEPSRQESGHLHATVRPGSQDQLDAWGDRGTLGS